MAKECLTGPGTASQTVRFGFCLSSLWRLGQFFWARPGPACNLDGTFFMPELTIGVGVVSFRECVRNLDLRVKVHPGEIWVSKQRVHIVLEASKSAVVKDDVPKICGLVLTHSLGVFKFVCTYFCTRLPLYRGSPTYAVFTTAKPTTAIFGL